MKKYLTYEETKQQLPKELLIQLLSEKTYSEIAQEYNANKRIISKIAQHDYGISKNYKVISKNSSKHNMVHIDEKELIHFYIDDKLSARKIAEIYHVTHSTILNKLRKLSIEVRPFNHEYYYLDRIKTDKFARYIDSSGYYILYINGEFIREHRYLMEKYLERELTDDEAVHHIDFNRLNNDIGNLFLFDKQQYHALYHSFIRNNEYINPEEFLTRYRWIIDEICDYDFLYNLYVNDKMTANAIHKYILNKYSFDIERVTIVKLLKKYEIYNLISPTINQYDDRICANSILRCS